jgi:hypothetical protein
MQTSRRNCRYSPFFFPLCRICEVAVGERETGELESGVWNLESGAELGSAKGARWARDSQESLSG